MSQENENIPAGQTPPPSDPGVKEEEFRVIFPEENTDAELTVKELPSGKEEAVPAGEAILQKVEEAKLPEDFELESPEALPLSRSEEKPGEVEEPLLPLEEPEEKKPSLLPRELSPVLSGGGSPRMESSTVFVRKSVSLPPECGSTLGELLTEARKRAGLSLEEVRELTKIRMENILALENNKEEELPPAVFVAAYTRTLQELYGLDPLSRERVAESLNKLLAETEEEEEKNQTGEVREMKNRFLRSITNTVKINFEEERKFCITAYCVLGGAVLFLFLMAVLILFLIFGGKKAEAEAPKDIPPFRGENISTVIPAVIPEVQKMDIPVGKAAETPSRKASGKSSSRRK